MVDEKLIYEVAREWDLVNVSLHPDIALPGSSERSIFRITIKSESQIYVLENIAPASVPRKVHIARALKILSEKELHGVYQYLLSQNGRYVEKINDTYWQLAPFIEGISLQRPEYVYDEWRGPVLAKFLLDLREKSPGIPSFEPIFSIKKYIDEFLERLSAHRHSVYEEIQPIIRFLENKLMDIHDTIPVAFCHGDYHPLNIIWSQEGINAVIDWEFCGYKPEIYDIANMIGCIGMEDPDSLFAELVKNFIQTLQANNLIADIGWRFLVESIISNRFAWLAIWLNDKDEDMVRLEIDYMQLLIDRSEELKRVWGI